MKILLLSQYWLPENGVPQRRWAWLTRILQRNGHEVLVICPPSHYSRSVSVREWIRTERPWKHFEVETGSYGETIVRTGYFPVGKPLTSRILNQAVVAVSMLTAPFRMPKTLKGYRPDIVIGTVPALPTSVVTSLIAKRYRKPYIIDLRDAWPALLNVNKEWNVATGALSLRERVARVGPLQVLSWVTERAMNKALREADGIITTSKKLEVSLDKKNNSTGQKLTTIRNVFPPRTSFSKAEPTCSKDTPLRVLYAGTLGRAQKLSNALVAAKQVAQAGVPIELRFVGDGAAWQELHEAAAKFGIEVDFRHREAAESLEEHYEWADTALVHLANWEPLTQAVPSKTYELMSLGLHISAAVEGESAELIESLHAGHVVPPEDSQALAQLWIRLSEDRSLLCVDKSGGKWVAYERNHVVPELLISFVNAVVGEQ